MYYKIHNHPSDSFLDKADGTFIDWTYSDAKITHSYIVELRPTRYKGTETRGVVGFLLSDDQITPTIQEAWEFAWNIAKHSLSKAWKWLSDTLFLSKCINHWKVNSLHDIFPCKIGFLVIDKSLKFGQTKNTKLKLNIFLLAKEKC